MTALAEKHGKKDKAAFRLCDPESGKTCTEADFQGSTLVLHFFATWCPACQTAMAPLNDVQKEAEAQGTGVRVLGVLLDEDVKTAGDFLRRASPRYPVFTPDPSHLKNGRFCFPGIGTVTEIPLTLLVDKDGFIQCRIRDSSSPEPLAKTLTRALQGLDAEIDSSANALGVDEKILRIRVHGMKKASGAT